MPFINYKESTTPWYLFNKHLQTIVTASYRDVLPVPYVRERIETEDGDFFDIDWSRVASKTLVILLHGLTGNSHRSYIFGMVRAMNKGGYDTLSLNCRSSSGDLNRKLQAFHSGWTKDLRSLIKRIEKEGFYESICLVGFSMGGNISLKYVGEEGDKVSPLVKAVVAFSVPIHLRSGVELIDAPKNTMYARRFLKKLKVLIQEKHRLFPNAFDMAKVKTVKKLRDLDRYFSCPVYGYETPEQFYDDIGALRFLENIRVPSLLVSSRNDPFLSEKSLPVELAKRLKSFTLQITKNGGHVGFGRKVANGMIWSENRALEFIKGHLSK